MLRDEYRLLYQDWVDVTNDNVALQSHIIELQAAAFVPKSPTSQRPFKEPTRDDNVFTFKEQMRQDEVDRRSRSQSTNRAVEIKRREDYELKCRIEELERELRRKDTQVKPSNIDRKPC